MQQDDFRQGLSGQMPPWPRDENGVPVQPVQTPYGGVPPQAGGVYQPPLPPQANDAYQQTMPPQGNGAYQPTPEEVYAWQLQQAQLQQAQLMQTNMQENAQPMPETLPAEAGFLRPPPRTKRPKEKKSAGSRTSSGGGKKWAILVFLIAVAGIGWFLWQSSHSGRPTVATITAGQIGNFYSGDALIVRDETSYDEEGVQGIEYIAAEGSDCYSGNIICNVYSTGYNIKELVALQDYRDEVKDFEISLMTAETAYDQKLARLDNDVVLCGLDVRSLVQGVLGNLTNQELTLETAINERQSYIQEKYASNARLKRLLDSEQTQAQRIDSWLKPKICTQTSIVSFYTDGFEIALTPAKYEGYSPAAVRAMVNGEKPETSLAARGRTSLYRLVRPGNFAVLLLVRNSTWNPSNGSVYKLVLEQYSDITVDARVRSSARAGGELLVRLDVIGDVREVLYLRTCQARLGENVDCLVVPANALTQQNETTGVVIMNGDMLTYIQVNVLGTSGDRAYISAVQTGSLSAGQTVKLFY